MLLRDVFGEEKHMLLMRGVFQRKKKWFGWK
jgi:hypothetical protein